MPRHDSDVTAAGEKRKQVQKEHREWTLAADRELVQQCDKWAGKGHKQGMNWDMVLQSLKDPASVGRSKVDLKNRWNKMSPAQKADARKAVRESPFAAGREANE